MQTKYRVITGEEGPIYRDIDEFFEGVKREIGDRTDGPSYFERKIVDHCVPHEPTALVKLEGNTQMLIYRGVQIVAAVVETRDDNNYVMFTFFKNLEDIISF